MKALATWAFAAGIAIVIVIGLANRSPALTAAEAAQPDGITPLVARDTNPPTILPRIPAVTNWPFTNLPPITNFAKTNLPAMTNPPPLHPPDHP